jgi:hypothetical protein
MVSDTLPRLTPAPVGGANAPALRPQPSTRKSGSTLRRLLRFEGTITFVVVALEAWASWGIAAWLLAGWQLR